jgi:hypothetical protein
VTRFPCRAWASRDSHYPEGRFWLRAEVATSLISDLASLSWRLGLPERDLPEQELRLEAVLRWLRAHQGWLLVVDNLDQPVLETMRAVAAVGSARALDHRLALTAGMDAPGPGAAAPGGGRPLPAPAHG